MNMNNINSIIRRMAAVVLMLAAAMPLMAQRVEVSQPVIDCGQVQYRHPVSVKFEARNQSGHQIQITDVRTSCGCTAVDYPREAIAHGRTFAVTATYDARQMGTFAKEVALYVRGASVPVYLTLRGRVVAEVVDYTGTFPLTLGALRADKSDIEFDDVNSGERPFHRIHVLNSSSKPMQPQVMHLPDYLQAQVSPSTIAPGKSGVVTLTLLSDRLRDYGLTQTSVYLGAYPGDRVAANKEVSVSVVLLPGFGQLTDRARELSPKLELSATELDLGSFDGKKKKRGDITITNHGRTPLEIRNIQMFTTGLELSLSSRTIAPGASARLRVTAVASGLKRARSKPRVLMITNDPDHAKVVIGVTVK